MLIFSNKAKAIFGVVDPLHLIGFPEGRAKIVLRGNSFAKVYIKTKTGIREFAIQEIDNAWMPLCETARNLRTT